MQNEDSTGEEQPEETQSKTVQAQSEPSDNQTGIEVEQELRERLGSVLDEVENHSVFYYVETVDDARVFLDSYVFAAWDFKILAEAFRRPEKAPTLFHDPPTEIRAPERADLSDRIAYEPGYRGHLEPNHSLVTEVMETIDADTSRFFDFLHALEDGRELDAALFATDVPLEVQEHVRTTVSIAQTQNLPQIAGALALGRRDIIPIEFASQLKNWHADSVSHRVESNEPYINLARGIELDNLLHADRILSHPKVTEPAGWREDALQSADKMLMARRELLDSIKDRIQNRDSAESVDRAGGRRQ